MIVKIIFVQFIKKIFNFFNFEVVKKKYIISNDEFNLSKLDLSSSNIILDYKLDDLITHSGKKLGSNEDLYFYALNSSLPIKERKLFIKSFIWQIKSKVKPLRKASEAIGLKDSPILNQYPEWALVLPWEDVLIEHRYHSTLKNFLSKRLNLKKFYNKMDDKNNENLIYHDLVWKSHAEQFYKLYNSISINGFKSTNPIPVNIFVYNDLYRLALSSDGNHRARVAYVLNKKTVPLKLCQIIDVREAEKWTNVKNGLYTINQAQKIFKEYLNYSGQGCSPY